MTRVAAQERAEAQNDIMRGAALTAWYVLMSIPTDKPKRKPDLNKFMRQLKLDQPVWQRMARGDTMSKAEAIRASDEAEALVRAAFDRTTEEVKTDGSI